MCFLSVTTTSSTLRDMGSCEEESLFSRSLTVFQNFLGLNPQRELLLKVTNFGLPDSLSALIYLLPEREPVSLSMCVLSLSPNAILEVEYLCKITVEPRSEHFFNSNFLYGGVFVIKKYQKRRSMLILYHFTEASS